MRQEIEKAEAVRKDAPLVHQCPHCFTVYDEQYSDERQGVAVGTPFEQLRSDYVCPTCDAPKQDMKAVQLIPAG